MLRKHVQALTCPDDSCGNSYGTSSDFTRHVLAQHKIPGHSKTARYSWKDSLKILKDTNPQLYELYESVSKCKTNVEMEKILLLRGVVIAGVKDASLSPPNPNSCLHRSPSGDFSRYSTGSPTEGQFSSDGERHRKGSTDNGPSICSLLPQGTMRFDERIHTPACPTISAPVDGVAVQGRMSSSGCHLVWHNHQDDPTHGLFLRASDNELTVSRQWPEPSPQLEGPGSITANPDTLTMMENFHALAGTGNPDHGSWGGFWDLPPQSFAPYANLGYSYDFGQGSPSTTEEALFSSFSTASNTSAISQMDPRPLFEESATRPFNSGTEFSFGQQATPGGFVNRDLLSFRHHWAQAQMYLRKLPEDQRRTAFLSL